MHRVTAQEQHILNASIDQSQKPRKLGRGPLLAGHPRICLSDCVAHCSQGSEPESAGRGWQSIVVGLRRRSRTSAGEAAPNIRTCWTRTLHYLTTPWRRMQLNSRSTRTNGPEPSKFSRNPARTRHDDDLLPICHVDVPIACMSFSCLRCPTGRMFELGVMSPIATARLIHLLYGVLYL